MDYAGLQPFPRAETSSGPEPRRPSGPRRVKVFDLIWITLTAAIISGPLAFATYIVDGLNDKPWNRVTSATYLRICAIGLGVGLLIWCKTRRGQQDEFGVRCLRWGLLASGILTMTFCIWGEWALRDTFRTSFERSPGGPDR
jgi:hypothetical protein